MFLVVNSVKTEQWLDWTLIMSTKISLASILTWIGKITQSITPGMTHTIHPCPLLAIRNYYHYYTRRWRASSSGKFEPEPQVGYLINSGAQLIIVDTAPTI